jgi:hypothetical protein
MTKLPSSDNSNIEKSTIVHAENADNSDKDAESQRSPEDEKVT